MMDEKQATDRSAMPEKDRKSDADKTSGNRPTPSHWKSEDSTGINPEKEKPIDPKMPHLPPD